MLGVGNFCKVQRYLFEFETKYTKITSEISFCDIAYKHVVDSLRCESGIIVGL